MARSAGTGSRALCVAFVMSVACVAFVLSGYQIIDEDPLQLDLEWPPEFYIEGETLDLYNGFSESFHLWYSESRNRSRKDINGHTDRVYYLADDERQVKVYPISTEEEANESHCDESVFEKDQPVFLPDTSGYSYSGSETVGDEELDVWVLEDKTEIGPRRRNSLHVRQTAAGYYVPVRFVEKHLSWSDGRVLSHTITNYYGFTDELDDDDLKYNTSDCEFESGDDDDEARSLERLARELHPSRPGELDVAWGAFTRELGAIYSGDEHLVRKLIFEHNWRKVIEHNRKSSSYKMALNEFSDRTPSELRRRTGLLPGAGGDPGVGGAPGEGGAPFPHSAEEVLRLQRELPDSYDLRFEGYITPVKSQGNCGSCWAFAVAATLEGAYAKKYGDRFLDLSEQAFVDCAWGFKNYGCSGGHLKGALEYVQKHGVPLEKDYGEYIQNNGLCEVSNASEPVRVRGWFGVTPRSPGALKVALHKYGPVAVSIAVKDSLYQYKHGIYTEVSCHVGETPTHGVVVVGYGARDGAEYWIVKNSWGDRWGQDGYVLMAAEGGICGVLDEPYAVIL